MHRGSMFESDLHRRLYLGRGGVLGHAGDGLAVYLYGGGAVKDHLDIIARQDCDEFLALDMLPLEDGGEDHQGAETA